MRCIWVLPRGVPCTATGWTHDQSTIVLLMPVYCRCMCRGCVGRRRRCDRLGECVLKAVADVGYELAQRCAMVLVRHFGLGDAALVQLRLIERHEAVRAV